MDVEPPDSFVLRHLPAPESRVLEVGCGRGDLARALDAAGHRVVAIDPRAPAGPIFRQVTLEDFADDDPFDAVVASVSLHHVHDLESGLDRIAALLQPDGVIVVLEHAFDRVDERTARWYASVTTDDRRPRSTEQFLRSWEEEHEGLHGYEVLRPALERRFEPLFFEWGPYLHHSLEEVSPAEEATLIEVGEIAATGFRLVGAKREDSTVRR